MPLEVILGIVVAAAVIILAVIIFFANRDGNVPAVAVPIRDFQEQVKTVPIVQAPVVPVINVQQQALEQRIKDLEQRLMEADELSTTNDALRFDNQALKKELMEVTEKYRELLTKYDGLQSDADAHAASFIKEKEMSNQQLVEEVEDLKRMQEKLKELNTASIGKSDMLQYELIKARAQATGYERISKNYQQQIETIMQKSNGNRLEALIVEG